MFGIYLSTLQEAMMLYALVFASVIALGLSYPRDEPKYNEKDAWQYSGNELLQKQIEELWGVINDMQAVYGKHMKTTEHQLETITSSLSIYSIL